MLSNRMMPKIEPLPPVKSGLAHNVLRQNDGCREAHARQHLVICNGWGS